MAILTNFYGTINSSKSLVGLVWIQANIPALVGSLLVPSLNQTHISSLCPWNVMPCVQAQ